MRAEIQPAMEPATGGSRKLGGTRSGIGGDTKRPIHPPVIVMLAMLAAMITSSCGPAGRGASPAPTAAPTKPAAPSLPSPTPSASLDAWIVACQAPPGATPEVSKVERSSVSGRAVSVAVDQVVVSAPDHGCVALQLSSYEVWDNLWVKNIPIEVGDDIFASDTPFGPRLYVNIVNLMGIISNVKREGDLLTFDLEYGARYGAKGGKDRINVDGHARVSGSGPREGQGGQVVGRRLKDGSVVGVTVFFN